MQKQILKAYAFCAAFFLFSTAYADPDSGMVTKDPAVHNPSLIPRYYMGKLTYDETLVTFRVGDVTYRIPGNYLVDIHKGVTEPQSIVSMTAVFPGPRPFNAETRHCYLESLDKRTPECNEAAVLITNSTENALSDPVVFERVRDLFHSQTPLPGPFGYELYEVGPDNARVEWYRKKISPNLILLSDCDMGDLNASKVVGICSTSFYNGRHAVIKIHFVKEQLPYIEDMVKQTIVFVDAHTLPDKT